ncbi:MAG: hypothetical protein NTU47_00055 [Ignavibacteriales bacterium]|nr:hypothetical protein [Ignavibacteriales bacterium]
MWHPDDHTLHLFAARAPEVASMRDQIERHVHTCTGCRETVTRLENELRTFEAHLDHSIGSRLAVIPKSNSSVAFPTISIPPTRKYPAYSPLGLWQRAAAFAVRHPAISFSSTIGALTSLLLILSLVYPGARSAKFSSINPNSGSSTIEILDSKNEVSLKIPTNKDVLDKLDVFSHRLNLIDLRGDGSKVIITTLPVPPFAGGNVLRVIDDNLSIVWSLDPHNEIVHFNERVYDRPFRLRYFVTLQNPKTGSLETFVEGTNTNSPSKIVRINDSGQILGEYYHFGQFSILDTLTLGVHGKSSLIIGGTNDVNENISSPFSFVAVLDPFGIEGKSESQATRGFGFPASHAEQYYLRLPENKEISEISGQNPIPIFDTSRNDSVLRIALRYSIGDQFYSFHLAFGPDLKLNSINPTSPVISLLKSLRERGTVKYLATDWIYLENMRKKTEYFDGRAWARTPTRVLSH